MTTSDIRQSRHRSGVAAVEFAVILPFIISLIMGIWEVGRVIEVTQIMSNAVREGARQAVTGQTTAAQVTVIVQNYLVNENLNITNLKVYVYNLGGPLDPAGSTNTAMISLNPKVPPAPSDDPTLASDLDQIQVTATVPFADVRWSPTQLFVPTTQLMTATAIWASVKDRAFSIPPPLPT